MSDPPRSMSSTDPSTTWPDLVADLYERLTERGAEISYEFQDMHVKVPAGPGPDAEQAEWVLDGTLRIRSSDGDRGPK